MPQVGGKWTRKKSLVGFFFLDFFLCLNVQWEHCVCLCDFTLSLLASWSITHVMIDNSLKVCCHGVTFSFITYHYKSIRDSVFETVRCLKLLSGAVIKTLISSFPVIPSYRSPSLSQPSSLSSFSHSAN